MLREKRRVFVLGFFFLLICVIQKTNITFNRAKVRQKENTMFVIGSIYCERVRQAKLNSCDSEQEKEGKV